MSHNAGIMMLISIVLVWGGFLLALWHLLRHPEIDED